MARVQIVIEDEESGGIEVRVTCDPPVPAPEDNGASTTTAQKACLHIMASLEEAFPHVETLDVEDEEDE